ncbi:hypothetical protein JCM10908_002705 [Rhodotorula pacifica]|uniref:Seg1p n=1 Tax=Rhodotorula pacifica TaxID=1495444 RepID=UPI003181F191
MAEHVHGGGAQPSPQPPVIDTAQALLAILGPDSMLARELNAARVRFRGRGAEAQWLQFERYLLDAFGHFGIDRIHRFGRSQLQGLLQLFEDLPRAQRRQQNSAAYAHTSTQRAEQVQQQPQPYYHDPEPSVPASGFLPPIRSPLAYDQYGSSSASLPVYDRSLYPDPSGGQHFARNQTANAMMALADVAGSHHAASASVYHHVADPREARLFPPHERTLPALPGLGPAHHDARHASEWDSRADLTLAPLRNLPPEQHFGGYGYRDQDPRYVHGQNWTDHDYNGHQVYERSLGQRLRLHGGQGRSEASVYFPAGRI